MHSAARTIDLSAYGDAAPGRPVDVLFLHHSVGAALLADRGVDDPARGVHPNGGGLRAALTALGYRVHAATYGSEHGQRTDMFDWQPKFARHMGELLTIHAQDVPLPDGERNEVVIFKSCFPNNAFTGRGDEPGDPRGPALTESNAKATLRSLLPLFAARSDTLFVYFTTPPLSDAPWPEPIAKRMIKTLLGKPSNQQKQAEAARIARSFNDWAASPEGWLKDYALPNVVVFHYFDLLTTGQGSFLRYPSGEHRDDSHPNAEGQTKACEAFVPFLNRAVRRAGLLDDIARNAESPEADATH
jgi:hypothetical protein